MIRVAVLTVSDSAFAGKREDLSGPALQQKCTDFGWIVTSCLIVPDEPEQIAVALTNWADNAMADLILTTGGTGISARDQTPEVTRSVLERELPGIAELMRLKGLDETPFSVLSRAVAGTRKRSLIINLPGAPKGAVYSLGLVQPLVPHALRLLAGDTNH